jgi:hypothetical protein
MPAAHRRRLQGGELVEVQQKVPMMYLSLSEIRSEHIDGVIRQELTSMRDNPRAAHAGAVGGMAGCCARAASGHATAAPPSAAKNFRRPMWLAM